MINSKLKNSIKNEREYNYILEWAKRHFTINDVQSLFEFMFRQTNEEDIEKWGEEPLKTAWGYLTDKERVMLTHDLSLVYLNRIN